MSQKIDKREDIQILDYKPEYRSAFKDLNVEWITKYFEMEEADYRVLNNPDSEIIEKGGRILIALYNGVPAGTCALLKMNNSDSTVELVKMAVSPKVRGIGIGWELGKAVTTVAKEMGANKIFLEGNTNLKASISLYHKLGFKRIEGVTSPYKRVDIQMELDLNEDI